MSDQDDATLVGLCQKGDRGAFERLVEKYQKTVFNIALRITRDPDDAEDVAQTAFIRVYRNLHNYDPKFKFFSWLYRIVVNEALNLLKQRKQYEGLEEETAMDEEGQHAVEEQEETDRKSKRDDSIQSGLMELKVDHRVVVVLRHLQGLSYVEIGQILGIPEKTVKSRLFSARESLRHILIRKGFRGNE